MAADARGQLIQDVLGSAHIFATAVNDLMEKRLQALTGEQLTFSQIKLLKLISRAESYNISQVAAFLGVSTAAASKAVDRLVRRELLRRSEAAEDRRAVELALTDEGRRMLERYERLTRDTLESLFGGFSADGLRQTADLLDSLSVNIVEKEGVEGELCFRCGIYFRRKCLLRSASGRECHIYSQMLREEEEAG
jgi:DNA-binding MarR family transcriptional regulator